jgi:hypothetical protein
VRFWVEGMIRPPQTRLLRTNGWNSTNAVSVGGAAGRSAKESAR